MIETLEPHYFFKTTKLNISENSQAKSQNISLNNFLTSKQLMIIENKKSIRRS